MPKKIDQLQAKTSEAYAQIRESLDRTTQQVTDRIEEMKKKIDRRHDERVQLRTKAGAR